MRVPEDQLAQIDKLADKAGLSRTDYVIRCALAGDPLDKRLASIDRRLKRLEER